jgi:hypothetical protein
MRPCLPNPSWDASPASFGRISATAPIPFPLSLSFPEPGSVSVPGCVKDVTSDEMRIIELLSMPSLTLHPTVYNKSVSTSLHLMYHHYIAIADAISVLQTKKDINPEGEARGIMEHNVKNIIMNKITYGDWASLFHKLDKAVLDCALAIGIFMLFTCLRLRYSFPSYPSCSGAYPHVLRLMARPHCVRMQEPRRELKSNSEGKNSCIGQTKHIPEVQQ